jgi:hypothetical protein
MPKLELLVKFGDNRKHVKQADLLHDEGIMLAQHFRDASSRASELRGL